MLSINRLFPLLAITVAALAYFDPSPLMTWNDSLVPLLALLMFCVGLTLRPADFKRVWNHPQPLALIIILQFTIMPLAALGLAKAFALSAELTSGILIISVCTGGAAANIITFLARGDVALSICMTLISTLWGIVATPWIIGITLGEVVQLNTMMMLTQILQMILLPTLLGMLITHYQPAFAKKVNQYLADIVSSITLLITAVIVSVNAHEVATLSYAVFAVIILHNLTGIFSGYAMGKLTKQTEVTCRTLAIELGMQNSALGAVVALKSFGPIAALPSALFGMWQYVSGAIVAGIWRWLTDKRIRAVEAKRAGRVQ